jgi:hypothetical protein
MTESKAARKSASPKRAKSKAPKAIKTSKAKVTSERAAEVESNLGGSQPLREFLNSIGWS